MNNKNLNFAIKCLFTVLVIILYTSCVSNKEYKRVVAKVDSTSALLTKQTKDNYILSLEYVKLKGDYLNHLKKDSISANNTSEVHYIENSLINFPNPPPQASSRYTMDSKIIKDFGKYEEINDWLVAGLNKTGYNGHFNYFLFDDGFTIATDLEQVNSDATLKRNDQRWGTSNPGKFKDGFSFAEYTRILFTAQPGCYRSFVFIVSPSLNHISSNSYSKELFSKYISQGTLTLPPRIGAMIVPVDLKITVLVYEFKKPENSKISNLIIGGPNSAFDHLSKSLILKNLKHGNTSKKSQNGN